jgi:hypothetical protein
MGFEEVLYYNLEMIQNPRWLSFPLIGPDVNQLLVTKNYIQKGGGSFPQVPVGEISVFCFTWKSQYFTDIYVFARYP